ncbi:MAG: glycosyltransferase family 4 protein [Candidatus Firestonebacteria bacterium]|nr:glycosyltransferase family 4 protein [Candidatus Firestonebacteria bacterium]
MKKINVLHLITKLELGGAQQNTLYTVKKHNREKYNVFLIAGAEGLLVEDAGRIENVKTCFIPELKHELSPFYDLKCLFLLRNIFKKEKIDIVHTHSSKAGILGRFAAKIAQVPVIIHTVHGFSFNDFQNILKKKLYIFLERIAAKITQKLVVVTKRDQEKGLKAGVGKKGQYVVIKSGFDLAEFSILKDLSLIRKEFNISGETKTVGMVACLKAQKNPAAFVKMSALVKLRHPGVKYFIVGDGEKRAEVEKLIDEYNLTNDIILTGWRKDVAGFIQLFDVVVLTSLWEGLPRVLPQAMCAKKPIVATAVDGSKEAVIDGVNGYLAPPLDYGAMAARVSELLSSEGLRKKMGENGFLMAGEWDQDKMVKAIEEVYEEILSKNV